MLTYELSEWADDDKAPFAAMIGMSGWLPFYKSIQKDMRSPKDVEANADSTQEKAEASDVDKQTQTLNNLRELIDLPALSSSDFSGLKTPVFIGHGTADPKVPSRNGEIAVTSLRELGMDVKWFPYENFGHWIQEPDEVNDMIDFLRGKAEVEVVGSKEK